MPQTFFQWEHQLLIFGGIRLRGCGEKCSDDDDDDNDNDNDDNDDNDENDASSDAIASLIKKKLSSLAEVDEKGGAEKTSQSNKKKSHLDETSSHHEEKSSRRIEESSHHEESSMHYEESSQHVEESSHRDEKEVTEERRSRHKSSKVEGSSDLIDIYS